MDNTQITSKVRSLLLTGDSVSDGAITFYIDLTKQLIKTECSATAYPSEMDNVLIDVIVALVNRRGKEGFNSVSEGDVSVSISSSLYELLQGYASVFRSYKEAQNTAPKLRFI